MTGNIAAFAVFLGMSLTLGMGVWAFAGNGRPKKFVRRLESLRERHSTSNEVRAEAQMKRIVSSRKNGKFDNFIKRFVPRPAELRARLDRTGRSITVERYAILCGGLAISVTIGLEVAGAHRFPVSRVLYGRELLYLLDGFADHNLKGLTY